VVPLDPSPVPGWALTQRRGPATLRFRLRAELWGTHELGHLWVRIRRPGGLEEREVRVAEAPSVRVLPGALRLDRLLPPREPRAVSGLHLSRLRSHGTDFADLRPYRPGDRLRDVSWATSARLGDPWVVVHHPERTGTVLLLLDTFIGEERETGPALARAARAAWAVASAHLRAQDRVGLLARGRASAWVPPSGGRRARWLLIDRLLSVGAAAEDPWRRRRSGRRVTLPADALVVGVTALRSRAYSRELLHHRRNGHATAALVIDTSDLVPPGADPAAAATRRLWLARREIERRVLERGGVPTVVVGEGTVGPAISALRRRMAWSRHGSGVGVA
jgi:uncharacterized protein (DUF58 family)